MQANNQLIKKRNADHTDGEADLKENNKWKCSDQRRGMRTLPARARDRERER